MKATSGRFGMTWVLLVAFSVNLVAVPNLGQRTPLNVAPFPNDALSSLERFQNFVSDFTDQARSRGWKIETQPGHSLSIGRLTGAVPELYLTPPSSAKVDLSFKVRSNFSTQSLSITAYDNAFRTVLSRRTISLRANEANSDQVRVRADQTLQSMADELAPVIRTAASPRALWQQTFDWLFPNAHAAGISSSDLRVKLRLLSVAAAAIGFITLSCVFFSGTRLLPRPLDPRLALPLAISFTLAQVTSGTLWSISNQIED